MIALTVVIPMYNEENYICDVLDSLRQQTDSDFNIVLVDNGSTDGTVNRIKSYLQQHPLNAEILHEPQKGTGAASDTGFRYAIANGATHIARTDADCIADKHWIQTLKTKFEQHQLDLIGGVIRPRADEQTLSLFDRWLIDFLLVMADFTGRIRRQGSEFQYPYFLVAGNNLAVSAEIYLQAGGFPRSCIEDMHEDRELTEKIRTLTPHAKRVDEAIVYNSLRRVRAYGYLNTVLWYWDHHYQPQTVDVR